MAAAKSGARDIRRPKRGRVFMITPPRVKGTGGAPPWRRSIRTRSDWDRTPPLAASIASETEEGAPQAPQLLARRPVRAMFLLWREWDARAESQRWKPSPARN